MISVKDFEFDNKDVESIECKQCLFFAYLKIVFKK